MTMKMIMMMMAMMMTLMLIKIKMTFMMTNMWAHVTEEVSHPSTPDTYSVTVTLCTCDMGQWSCYDFILWCIEGAISLKICFFSLFFWLSHIFISRCTTLFDKNKKTESVLVKALAGSALKNPNMMVTFLIISTILLLFTIITIIILSLIVITVIIFTRPSSARTESASWQITSHCQRNTEQRWIICKSYKSCKLYISWKSCTKIW